MKLEIIEVPEILVCYLQTEMTNSYRQNYAIIRQHWKSFNNLLRIHKVKLGYNWEKYAITKKSNGHYYYQCAFPAMKPIHPFDFGLIPAASYLKFSHIGPMNTIWKTLNEIYNAAIPNSNINIDPNRSMIHFEYYDKKFKWNQPDSIIEIYVPLGN